MGKCLCHPEIETTHLCQKDNVYLCAECLACRTPDSYCKFRSACPIWYMQTKGAEWGDEKISVAKGTVRTVVFMPDNKEVKVPEGATLLEAAQIAGVRLNASCNGKGVCGKCKLILESGDIAANPTHLLNEKEKERNYVLACQSIVRGDISVKIPEETLQRRLKVAGMGKEATERLRGLVKKIRPMWIEVPLELNAPTLDDSVSDLDRLNRGLKTAGYDVDRLSVSLEVMRDLASAMRNDNWKVTAFVMKKKGYKEILHVTSGNEISPSLGLAIDVGTTTIVVYLVDMTNGNIIAATAGHNNQAACGDDVINRIICAEKDGVKKLSKMGLFTINGLIDEALDSIIADPNAIKNVVISGNTTMVHLLLEIEPRYIRREPYIPIVSEFPVLKGSEVGLRVNPSAAVFVMPGPASYVGGDIVSGLLYAGFHREEPLTLFIDVGTNGEIVLGNKDWLMAASCSAGPAFEGGGVRWGMRAEEGAIEKISINPETLDPTFSTVGNVAPRGICGSGMIDLITEMLLARIIDQKGKFIREGNHYRMKQDENGIAYIVAFAEETAMDEDIIFTEPDIENILRSKGAIYAGFTVLLNLAGLNFSMIDRIWIAGGFGQYLDIEKAIIIGMLPDIDRNRFKYFGNSSIAGAYLALLSSEFRKEAIQLSKKITYIDFSSSSQFMHEFTSALFLPHTHIDEFPSVKKKLNFH